MAFNLSSTPEVGEKLVLMGELGDSCCRGLNCPCLAAITRPLDGVPHPVSPISLFCGGPCRLTMWWRGVRTKERNSCWYVLHPPQKNVMQFKAMHKYLWKCNKENLRVREPEAGFLIEWMFTTTWNLIHYKVRLTVQIEGSKGCVFSDKRSIFHGIW